MSLLKDNGDFLKEECEAFETQLNENQKNGLKLEREFLHAMQKEAFSKPTHWWNKLAAIEEPEL